MSYVREFQVNWQTVLATFIGIATGQALSHYTMSLFAPELIAAFGWSKAEFALVSALPIVTAIITPLAGRFTDRFGARLAASLGFVAISLGFFGMSVMTGSLILFFAIWLGQHMFGVMTTSLVFTRVIVERFDKARGSALSALMLGPPISGAVVAPILGWVIASQGWRAGFVFLAVLSAMGGLVCIVFMGRAARKAGQPTEVKSIKLSRAELMAVAKSRVFILIVAGMAMINIAQPFAASQLKLVVLAKGVADDVGTWMVSLYAVGVIIGRIIFGVLLDRVPANMVALVALSLPAIGFLVLASPTSAVMLLAAGILTIGIAQGAEGDIGGYLVSRHFDLKNYALIFSFVKSALDGGGAIGALLLSYSLTASRSPTEPDGSYVPFLLLCAASTIVGAILFFMTGRDTTHKVADDAKIAPEAY
ncbi:MAG: MFS transporter [Novosphingobium sp.]|nr:MFS transporter [Novosphingobium sp.]